MSRRLFVALPAFCFSASALAALPPAYVSEAIDNGEGVVARIASVETHCETFAIDERANLTATYLTAVSVEEVLAWPAWVEVEPLVVGETIDIRWTAFTPGIEDVEEADSCEAPELGMSAADVRTVVLLAGDDAWAVDTTYASDVGDVVVGEGVLPACGEDEQLAVLDGLLDEPAGDTDEPSDADSADGANSADDADPVAAGCSVMPLSGVGPVAAVLGLLGLTRRRRG